MPMGVPRVFGVFEVGTLNSEPFELVLRSNADSELSFLTPPNVVLLLVDDDDEDCKEGGTKELGVGGAYDGVNG